jgi:hypothetical protein
MIAMAQCVELDRIRQLKSKSILCDRLSGRSEHWHTVIIVLVQEESEEVSLVSVIERCAHEKCFVPAKLVHSAGEPPCCRGLGLRVQ